jgi:hypothetical protein
MRTNATLRNVLLLGFVSLIIYAVIDGILAGSARGISMGLCSMAAFVYSIHLSRKLAKAEEEEEQY